MAFKIIEGGGREPSDYHGLAVISSFRTLVVEVLRALARGEDAGNGIFGNLAKFLHHLGTTSQHPNLLINEAIKGLHACICTEPPEQASNPLEGIVQASLHVAADSCCTESGAQGRANQKRRALEARIAAMLQHRARWNRSGLARFGARLAIIAVGELKLRTRCNAGEIRLKG